MTTPRPSIHDRLTDLADATRCRILLALESHELTVGELCAALQLPQSTVSRHLKILSDEAWLSSRADGASRWYNISAKLDPSAASLWQLVRAPLASTPSADQDLARVASVLATRRARSEAFFAGAAPDWDSTRSALFGQRADLSALLALLDPNWTVGDLGCGTGTITAAIAPHVQFVHAVDASPQMLDAARERLSGVPNARLSIMLLVLHHVAEPARALAEVQRVLKPSGRLLIVDMRTHTHEEYRQQMGHVWLGFDESALTSWLAPAGFTSLRYVPLPVEPNATGPALFAATAFVSPVSVANGFVKSSPSGASPGRPAQFTS